MQTVGDKTLISGGARTPDRYGLLITVGGVGGDFSQTGVICKMRNCETQNAKQPST